jgi:D-glycero-beta-D-manno-heptose 1-phosphate adenylyltransferase
VLERGRSRPTRTPYPNTDPESKGRKAELGSQYTIKARKARAVLAFVRRARHTVRVRAKLSCGAGQSVPEASQSMGQIVSQDEVVRLLGREGRGPRRIVFTNGCFDLLHPGHVRLLEEIRSLGDVLIVGLNSDSSVRRIKGDSRPLIPEGERAEILAALSAVDFVVIFDDTTPQDLIARLLPDVLAKGTDWAADEIVGRKEVQETGGRVISIPLQPGYSTTDLLQKILAAPSSPAESAAH